MIDLEAIRARDQSPYMQATTWLSQSEEDRRALLAYVDALREAAGIVECKACNMPLSWELWPIMADCPACSRARALLGQGEAPK